MSGPRDEDDLREKAQPEADEGQLAADSDEGLDGEDEHGSEELDGDGDDQGERDALGSDDGATGQGPLEVDKPLSRGERRFQKLANEAKEAKEVAAAAKRELDEFKLRSSIPTVDQVKARRDAEIAQAQAYGPEQVYETRLRHVQEDSDSRLRGIEFRLEDGNDRSSFASLCARNPAIEKISDRVEAELANLRRQGGNAQREVVAKFILGDMAIRRAPAAKTRATAKADIDRNRERSKPVRSGGDVAPRSQKGGDDRVSRADRLKDLNI